MAVREQRVLLSAERRGLGRRVPSASAQGWLLMWLLDPLHGDGYQFWSGIGANVSILGGVIVLYFDHTCGEPGCWRLGRHMTPEGRRCRRHSRPLPEQAWDAIAEIRESVQAREHGES